MPSVFQVPFKTVVLLPFKINKIRDAVALQTMFLSGGHFFLSHVKLNFRNLTYHPIQKN